MAADKTTKRRAKAAKSDEGETSSAGGRASRSSGAGGSMLRLRTDARKERRYEPKASAIAVISVIGTSIGAVLLGAGVYGEWLRNEEVGPHRFAPYLLLGGALLVLAMILFGPRTAKPVRVGDAGIAVEKGTNEIDRIEWRDVTRIVLGGDLLTIQSPGIALSIPVKLQGQAAARVVSEARTRIPTKVEDVDASGLPSLEADAAEVMPLEPPQLAGSRCKASDELITFEKDARLCGRCGEVYAKNSVPARCLTCDAPLR